MVSREKGIVLDPRDMPDERRHHRKGKHCGCRGRGLLALRTFSDLWYAANWHQVLHRLKLVTGVEISTRPVRKAGREGKAKKNANLRAAAEVKRMAFRRSMTMFIGLKRTLHPSHLICLP